MHQKRTDIQSWGRLNAEEHSVFHLARDDVWTHDAGSAKAIPLGLARSYGDVCLNDGGPLLDLKSQNRMLKFDPVTGHLTAEAGVSLSDIQNTFVGQGWLLPVTPGTQYVTLGGAVANDVHGKNHHAVGCFGNHVTHVVLQRSDGGRVLCSPDEEPDLFQATIGGMGLTGVIVEVGLKLRPVKSGWLKTRTVAFDGLERFFELSQSSADDWEYTVSWIDCVRPGQVRGIFMCANHADGDAPLPTKRAKTVPFTPPISLINQASLRVFNKLYFHSNLGKAGSGRQDFRTFFYPLDALREWNRIYGPKGFYQYQSVVPYQDALAATQQMLDAIAEARQGSFLMVLKTFGDIKSPGMLSFPMPGVTLAMDFPNKGDATHQLFKRLDSIVADAGGRIYPAKDARMPRDLFQAGYPGLEQFSKHRDPGLSSALSRRLLGY